MTPTEQHNPAVLQRCIKRLKAIVQALLDDDKPRRLTTTTKRDNIMANNRHHIAD